MQIINCRYTEKADLVNVGYDQVAFLKGKRIAVTGRVSDLGGKPTMYIGNGKDVEFNDYDVKVCVRAGNKNLRPVRKINELK